MTSSVGVSPRVTLCGCETAWVSKVGVLEVTWGFNVFWWDPAGAPQEYLRVSAEGDCGSSPVWAGWVHSANLEMPWPLAIGAGAPAHSSRAAWQGGSRLMAMFIAQSIISS